MGFFFLSFRTDFPTVSRLHKYFNSTYSGSNEWNSVYFYSDVMPISIHPKNFQLKEAFGAFCALVIQGIVSLSKDDATMRTYCNAARSGKTKNCFNYSNLALKLCSMAHLQIFKMFFARLAKPKGNLLSCRCKSFRLLRVAWDQESPLKILYSGVSTSQYMYSYRRMPT